MADESSYTLTKRENLFQHQYFHGVLTKWDKIWCMVMRQTLDYRLLKLFHSDTGYEKNYK